MGNIKTAISMDEGLFHKAEELSKKMDIPRSRLFQFALSSYIEQYENIRLLKMINDSYSNEATAEEKKLRKAMKDYHRKIIKDKWQ